MDESGSAAADATGTGPGPPPPPLSGSGSSGRDRSPLIWGSVLLALGLLWLLRHVALIGRLGMALTCGVVLFGVAALCLQQYGRDPRHHWGLLIPAGFFASFGTVICGEIVGLMPGPFVPPVFFAGPAAAFYHIHQRDPRRTWALVSAWLAVVIGVAGCLGSLRWIGGLLGWPAFVWGLAAAFVWHFLRAAKDWALIAAGVATTVGLTLFLDAMQVPGRLLWAVLLVGLGASLGVYYLLGKPGQVRWAAGPAVVLAVLGVLTVLAGPLLTFGIPVAFVAFGLYLLLFYGEKDAA